MSKYSSSSSQSSGGIGLLGAFALLFTGLKLGGVIAWSWWWVLAPLWIPFAIVIVLIVILAIVSAFD